HRQPTSTLFPYTTLFRSYQRNKHLINLFIAPASANNDTKPTLSNRRGYNVFRWTHGEMEYWAVSDLNQTELRQFADLLTQLGLVDRKSTRLNSSHLGISY